MIPYVAGPQLVHLHELAVIGELGDDFVNVIGSPGIRRHDIHEPRALPVERVAGLHDRREVMTVRRKQRNQVTDVVEARLLVVVHEVRNAGVLRVHLGTAELLRNHAGGAHVTAEDAPWMAPDPVTTPSLKGCPAPWSSDASDAGRCRVPRKNPHRAGAQAAPGDQLTLAMLARRRQVIALDRLLTDLPQTMDVIAYRHRVLPLVRHGTGGAGRGRPGGGRWRL